uniref:WRKY transcription factor 23 n=1 Tax=Santalum album TaxID=35974 RepID=A0A650C2Y3_SANAL|nr:WRKY transcription factor 23 [Santalum album]
MSSYEEEEMSSLQMGFFGAPPPPPLLELGGGGGGGPYQTLKPYAFPPHSFPPQTHHHLPDAPQLLSLQRSSTTCSNLVWAWGDEVNGCLINNTNKSRSARDHHHHHHHQDHHDHHDLGVSAHYPMKVKKTKGRRNVREPRFCFKTMTDVDILDDGYKWRKYGQKVVKNTLHPRNYYRCTQDNCKVKKRVERSAEDPRMVITTYEGRHAHSPSLDVNGDALSPSHQHLHLNNFFY